MKRLSLRWQKVSDEMTGLASMLQWFKEEVQLDVTSISLVELTNAHINKEKCSAVCLRDG